MKATERQTQMETPRSFTEQLSRAWNERARNPRAAVMQGRELLAQARSNGDKHDVVRALLLVAWGELSTADFPSALKVAGKALSMVRTAGDRQGEAVAHSLLGSILGRSGRLDEAKFHHSRALETAGILDDPGTEAMVLNGFGNFAERNGENRRAIDFHTAALTIARSIGARDEEASALLGLGNAWNASGEYHRAIDYYQQATALAEEIGQLQVQAYATGNIGILHERLGDAATALVFELRSLSLKEELGDRWAAAVSMNNIGIIYKGLGNYASALDYLLRSFNTSLDIGDRTGEMVALHNLGQVYEALGDRKHVLDNYQRVLALAEGLGDREGMAFASGSLGRYHFATGDFRQALLHLLKSLRLHREIGNRFGERDALESLAELYRQQRGFTQARELAEQALAIAEETGDVRGMISGRSELGAIEAEVGDTRRALSLLEEGLRMAREKNFADDIRKVTRSLADVCERSGEGVRARHYRQLYHDCMQRIFNSEETRRVRQFITRFEQTRIRQQAERFGLEPEEIAALSSIDILGDFDAIAPQGDTVVRSPSSEIVQRNIVVKTFGDLQVSVDGRPLTTADWGRKKARDLFKFLLIHHRRTVTIHEIMEKLWDGASDRKTEMVVMNAVSRIRRALEPGRNPRDRHSVLTSNDRTYRLDLGEEADIDFLRFKELIVLARRVGAAEERYGHYAAAAELYTDDFLKEDYYEAWTISERDLLKDAFLEALEYIAGEEIRREEFEQGAATARRIIAGDSTSERGYEILLTALAARGRRAEIRQTIADCIRSYQSEFGTPPPSQLLQLADSAVTAPTMP